MLEKAVEYAIDASPAGAMTYPFVLYKDRPWELRDCFVSIYSRRDRIKSAGEEVDGTAICDNWPRKWAESC